VIRETIKEMNKVAIGRVVLTNREHIIALEPFDKGLVGTLLCYPYEVRSEAEYFDEIQDVKVTKDMLDLAKHIVEKKSGPRNSRTTMKPRWSISSTASARCAGASSRKPRRRRRRSPQRSRKSCRRAAGDVMPIEGMKPKEAATKKTAASQRKSA
jgi:DNA end-binding protein Ku